MLILEVYKSLITEAHIDSCVKDFGYQLFGHELGGDEKNTPIENAYVKSIEDFSKTMYGKNINPKFVSAMEKLKGCMKEYPEVLIPEKTKVYRGLTIPVKYFIDNKQPISLNKTFPFTYTPMTKIESWSPDYEAASLFGKHDEFNELAKSIDVKNYATPEQRKELLNRIISEGIKVAIVIEYETNPQEFMFKSKYFRLISNVYYEDEILRISDKTIKVIAKFNDSPDIFSFKGMQLLKLINQAILD
jgi:hypothetical protein